MSEAVAATLLSMQYSCSCRLEEQWFSLRLVTVFFLFMFRSLDNIAASNGYFSREDFRRKSVRRALRSLFYLKKG